MIKCGEIILISYPFTDQTTQKLRPALVVSLDRFNSSEDRVVVPISSRIDAAGEWSLAVRETDHGFDQTGLRCNSAIKWTKPLTISRRVVVKRLGYLSEGILRQVQEQLASMFISSS